MKLLPAAAALLIYQGGKLVVGAISGWLTTLNANAAAAAAYWTYIQFGPYALGFGAEFPPPPSPAPVPGPPVASPPPYVTAPPTTPVTDPGFDQSPAPSDQGSAQAAGDVSYEAVTF